jgi:hypothetical protein
MSDFVTSSDKRSTKIVNACKSFPCCRDDNKCVLTADGEVSFCFQGPQVFAQFISSSRVFNNRNACDIGMVSWTKILCCNVDVWLQKVLKLKKNSKEMFKCRQYVS